MTTARRLIDGRLVAVLFGAFFCWTEVTASWHHWGLAGQIFSYTAFIPLQLYVALKLRRAARREELPPATRRGLSLFAINALVLALGSATLAWFTIGATDEAAVTPA